MEEILLTRLDELKAECDGRTNGRENGKNSRKYRFLDRFAGVSLQLGCVARKRDRLGWASTFSFKDRSNASDVNEHSSRRNRRRGGGGGGVAAAAAGKEEEEEEEIVAPFFSTACLLSFTLCNRETVSSSVSSVTTYESRLSKGRNPARARAYETTCSHRLNDSSSTCSRCRCNNTGTPPLKSIGACDTTFLFSRCAREKL